jgi:Ca-activated chloride channel family protein
MLTLRVGYAYPEGGARQAAEFALVDHGATFAEAGTDFRFAAAVAAFGMALREGPEKGAAALDRIEAWGKEALGDDTGGYRREFLQLVAEARMAANGAGRAQ